jgi:peptidoglycan/LPS O-acetylase OafA/YrhL
VRVFTLDLGQFVFKLFFAYPGISLIMGIIGLLISKKLWIAPLISFLSFSIVFYFFTTKMQFRIELIAYSLGFALIAFIGSALTAGIRKIIKSRSKE